MRETNLFDISSVNFHHSRRLGLFYKVYVQKWAFPFHNEVSSKDIQRARRIALRTRSSAACAKCRETKTKCNDYRPCARCKRNGEACDPVNAEVLNHIGCLITLMCIVLLLVRHRSIEHQVINLQLEPVRVLVKANSQSSDTRHSKRLRAESMKDESSAKLTSDSQSGYATSSNRLQVRTSRPSMGMEMSKVEQAPCTPLLSRRPEEGALFLPCDERCINATCPTFPGPRPKQPFPSNNEFGATPCSAYRTTMPTVSRPSQIIALQPAWPATWLSLHPPAVSAGPLLGLASGNRLLPMLAGGGWPGAAGRAAEGSIAPLRSWLSAAAAAVSADILSLGPAPLAYPV